MQSILNYLLSVPPDRVYLSLAGILLLCGLGLPIPEDISLISCGYLAYKEVIDVHVGFAVCFLAVLLGDSAAFFMGRFGGQRVLAGKLARRYFTPKKQLRVRAYFRRYGSKVIFVARFAPGLRFTLFFSAGTLHLRTATFLIWDSMAAIISVPVLVYSAYFFGEYIDSVVKYVRRTEHGIFVLILVAAVILAVRALRKRSKRAAVSVPEPPRETPP